MIKLKIGKRNIKTAIAVFISMLLSNVFKFEYPFFAVIAAIFTMENSIASSYKAGLYRMIGTLVGAFTGVLFISIHHGNPFLIALGTLVLIFICNTFKWDRAVPIAGVVFASIMLSLNNKNPLQYSFSRIVDTFAGIAVAVAVNYLLFPQDNLVEARKNIDSISENISNAIKQFVCSGKTLELNSIRKEIIDAIKFLETYKIEFNPRLKGKSEFLEISNGLESLRSLLSNLETVEELAPLCFLNPENAERVRFLKFCDIDTDRFSENCQNTIFNYHVGKILDTLVLLTRKL